MVAWPIMTAGLSPSNSDNLAAEIFACSTELSKVSKSNRLIRFATKEARPFDHQIGLWRVSLSELSPILRGHGDL
jgi:hypothetical protein